MSTEKTVAELMALADAYADAAADGVLNGGMAKEHAAKAALEQAIRRAVDWGEPVAAVVELLDPPGDSQLLCWTHVATETYPNRPRTPLYARGKL